MAAFFFCLLLVPWCGALGLVPREGTLAGRRRGAGGPLRLAARLEAAATAPLTPDLDRATWRNDAVGVEIKASPGKGFGAFATRRFEAEVVVGDYAGERLDERDVAARYRGVAPTWRDGLWVAARKARGVTVTGDYIFKVVKNYVEDDLYVDAEDPKCANWARFINHGAAPNLRVKSLAYSFTGEPRVWFVSTRPIEPGDELLFDYGEDYWFDDDHQLS